ncbi:MAG: hypothetical protein HOO99_17990 [Hyphomicrobiaceae bacterium]|nr:hypothetical protein [Hyphomicrobiaceae bacterium]
MVSHSRQTALTESDAVEIWIARWLRVPRKDLIGRYGCDSRRLYEIWWSERFPGARAKAADAFRQRYPSLTDRTVFGYRRISRAPTAAMNRAQSDLFA